MPAAFSLRRQASYSCPRLQAPEKSLRAFRVVFRLTAFEFETLALQSFVGALQIPVQFGQSPLRLRQPRDERHGHANGEKENDEDENEFQEGLSVAFSRVARERPRRCDAHRRVEQMQ